MECVSERVLASELREHQHEVVTMAGWLHRRRQYRTMTFASPAA